jgi:molybdopterin molybdotransferase
MNAISRTFGCASGAMSFDAALHLVLNLAPGKMPTETVQLMECVGRVIAESFLARSDLPRFDQSAMDGYAVRCADLTPGGWLPVTGRTAAGQPPGTMGSGGVHRILTGAPLPEGADAIIAQESVHRHNNQIGICRVPDIGTNVRCQGEDIRVGKQLIAAGTTLDWRHITVLAAQGVSVVAVRKRPRVTLLSSGRELRTPDQELGSGQIHDSNLPMLVALLRDAGADVQPMAIVSDDTEAMRSALRGAAENANLVITTAGISVGDEDHVRDALNELGGELSVLSVAMKPGKPLAAGRLGDAVFVGLPGNPMAALAGAVAFVRPLLGRMTGSPPVPVLRAHAGFDIRRKPGRTELIPVRLRQHDACLWAERSGPDGSGRLSPILAATGFAVLSAEDADVRRGTILEIMPFVPGAL